MPERAAPRAPRPPGAPQQGAGPGARSGDKAGMRPGRSRVETTDYAAFLRRVIAAHGRRVASGDLDALGELAALGEEVDGALAEAVAGLRAEPHAYSWQAIADALGVTRQAVMDRWPHAGGARKPGGQPGRLR